MTLLPNTSTMAARAAVDMAKEVHKVLFLMPPAGAIVDFEYFGKKLTGKFIRAEMHSSQPEIYGLVARIEVSRCSFYVTEFSNITFVKKTFKEAWDAIAKKKRFN